MSTENAVSINEMRAPDQDLDNIRDRVTGGLGPTRAQHRMRALERLRSPYPLGDEVQPEERYRGASLEQQRKCIAS